MKNVIIRIGPGAPEQVCWAEQAADGSGVVVREGALETLARYRGRRRVVVLVPAASVLLTEAPLPAGSRKRALKAIPFALEEQLAADVETLHFAYGAKQTDGNLPVAVVSHESMQAWLAMLQQAGIEADVILPEILAVPFAPDGWSVLLAEETAMVRTGLASGYAVDPDNLEIMLLAGLKDAAEKNQEDAVRIELYGGSGDLFADQVLRNRLMQKADLLTTPADTLRILAVGLTARPPINLLQGSYGPHAEWGMVWKSWRLAVALLVAFLVLQAGTLIYDVVRLGYESRELSRQMDQLFLKTFPDAKKVVHARAQMEQRLNALQGNANSRDLFLTVLAKSGDTFLNTPGFELESLRYKDGRLEIDFAVRDLQTLDSMKTLLMSEAGLEVEIRTASAKADRVVARLLIRGKGQ